MAAHGWVCTENLRRAAPRLREHCGELRAASHSPVAVVTGAVFASYSSCARICPQHMPGVVPSSVGRHESRCGTDCHVVSWNDHGSPHTAPGDSTLPLTPSLPGCGNWYWASYTATWRGLVVGTIRDAHDPATGSKAGGAQGPTAAGSGTSGTLVPTCRAEVSRTGQGAVEH